MAVKNLTEKLNLAGEEFVFHLCSKETQFGELEFEQWWMSHTSVYGDRQRHANNFQSLIDFWWADCRQHGTHIERDVQQMYTLARLLPSARSNGSRKVFVDSVPTRREKLNAQTSVVASELNNALRQCRGKTLDEAGFLEKTADAIGPPHYSDSAKKLYREMEAELFDDAHAAFVKEGEAGLEKALTQWEQWCKSISRRAGKHAEKEILDVLSYECRTALHQFYAQVWAYLIRHLSEKYDFSQEWQYFHSLWHGLHYWSDMRVDLFHGHIFALHPAAANFILTRRGNELIEAWLLDPASDVKRHELLYGLSVAVHDYAARHNVYAELRKKQPESLSELHLDTISGAAK